MSSSGTKSAPAKILKMNKGLVMFLETTEQGHRTLLTGVEGDRLGPDGVKPELIFLARISYAPSSTCTLKHQAKAGSLQLFSGDGLKHPLINPVKLPVVVPPHQAG